MRPLISGILVVSTFGLALGSAQAKTVDMLDWFLHATAFTTKVMPKAIAAPDFLGGKTTGVALRGQALCKFKFDWSATRPAGGWLLVRYDRRHHIGLAILHDDSDGCALFKASAPALSVPDADLSQSSTSRGLQIGSPYSQVLSIYGPPAKRGRHFVATYAAMVPVREIYKTARHPDAKLPERITLVIDDGYVSSILIDISEGFPL
jgi:hypothetical protein